MKNNTIFIGAIVSVLFGLFIGYAIWGNKAMDMDNNMNMGMSPKTGGHMMPDGTMMGGMGGSMSMDSMMQDMMANLNGKTGAEFDKAFLTEMIMHHEGAVVMAQAALTATKRPELLTLAKNIISAQTTEIKMMKDWQKSWFTRNQ